MAHTVNTDSCAQMPAYGPTDEADRMNKCLVPRDFDWTPEHAVTDKQFRNLYSQLPYDSPNHSLLVRHELNLVAVRAELVEAQSSTHISISSMPTVKWIYRAGQMTEEVGASHRIGRAISLRSMAKKQCDASRKTLKHNGSFLPVILEV
jgi:hypothetical protein